MAKVGNTNGHGNKLKTPTDIVGKQLGVYKVLALVSSEACKNTSGYRYYYECQCTKCGDVRKVLRGTLTQKTREHAKCKRCNNKGKIVIEGEWTQEHRTKAIESSRRSKRNYNNRTTGIKHYYIQEIHRRTVAMEYIVYTHRVSCEIDKQMYMLLLETKDTPDYPKAKRLANELNEILHTGGKEAFLKWYEKGEWKC